MTPTEARLIMDLADERLRTIEWVLLDSSHQSRLLHVFPVPHLRRFAHRLRALFSPRIGRLRHYPPRPLALPASYRNVSPPVSAPTISIVTPSLQQGRFIERTIWSVVSQGYPALEYVVQDGGSTDGTLQLLQRFGDHLSHWVSEPDGGHADAVNRGFDKTTGEVMGWLNSDDLLLPGALACVGAYFAAHPEIDVVYGNRLLIDENDGEIGAWILPEHDDLALTLADFVPQETLFWRRRIWDTVGSALDESYSYALDWDLLLRFRAAGARIVRIPRLIGAFRVHGEQRTTADRDVGLDEMARLRERTHGRSIPPSEVYERLRPYLRRHVRAHLRHRLAERIPHERISVTVHSDTRRPASRESPTRVTSGAQALARDEAALGADLE